jgi:site-specific recombinase XerD
VATDAPRKTREKLRPRGRAGVAVVPAARAALPDLLAAWLDALRAADRAPRTVVRYGGAGRGFLAWFAAEEGRLPAQLTLADLTPIALVAYRTALQRTAATSTVNTHLCALRVWCAWLTEQGRLPADPAARLRLVAHTAPDAPTPLPDAAVNALLRAAQRGRYPARDYALLQVLLQTGLRVGECQALTWGDIALGEKRGTVLIRAGKGNKARTVPLNGSARAALAVYAAPRLAVEPTLRAVAAAWPRAGRPAGAAASGEPPPPPPAPGDPLWRSQKGPALSASALWRVVHGLVQEGARRGLVPPATTPHTLRHTFARRYLDAHPGDLVALARLLGHSDLNTTGIYTQPTAADLAERVDRLPLNAYA